MSTTQTALVWPIQLPMSAKMVLVSLADQANDEGFCWPSIESLSVRTCMCERAVQKALRALEAMGLLQVVERGSSRRTNQYWLRVREWLAAQPKPAALEVDEPFQQAKAAAPEKAPATPHQVHPEPGAPRTTCTHTPHQVHPNHQRTNTNTTPIPPAASPQGADGPSDADPSSSQPDGDSAKGLGKSAGAPGRHRAQVESLLGWLMRCGVEGRKPIPEDDPVFAYADRVGIGREILALHWAEFKRRRLEAGKGQRDWPRTFRNSVEGNWYGLWFLRPDGEAQLTTRGEQARRAHAAAKEEAAAQRREAQPKDEGDAT
jgi:hypothetical protein